MKLNLDRFLRTARGIFGLLMVVEPTLGTRLFTCFTVERPWLNNENNVSCVPAGTYPLVFEMSEKFHRLLWELKAVPGRKEAKIHVANFPEDLEGCIGLGDSLAFSVTKGHYVANSRTMLEAFHRVMAGRTTSSITIEDRYGPIIGS